MKKPTQREQMAYSTIARLEAELAQIKTDGWIKCSDRLPEPDVIVIGSGRFFDNPELGRWVQPTIYSLGDFRGLIDGEDGETGADHDTTMSPTHWQPLPAPPTE